MRAVVATDLKGPQSLQVQEVPEPDTDGVGIDVRAAGIGFVDTLIIRGRYQVRQEPPFVPGLEVAGVVARPAGAFCVGDRVIAYVEKGGCAARVVAPVAQVAPLSERLSFAQGAAMVINHCTAHAALVYRARLQPGERVLVHGAAGGLGNACVQIAAALGGQVHAVAGSAARRVQAAEAGATSTFGHDEWFNATREMGGADVIVDPVGGDTFTSSIRCMRTGGRLLTVGFAGGEIPSAAANLLLLKNAGVLGVNWAGLAAADPELFRRTVAEIDALRITPGPITERSLDDAPGAFHALEDREVTGKLVLIP